LREQFNTQRKVQQFFAARADDRSLALRDKLYDMIADVLLIEEQGSPGAFHFQFNIETTTAFKEMSPDVRSKVKDLYVDYFYRRQDGFWALEGMKRLPALKRTTGMLICGEDLGMVPACVPRVMRDLGLLSLEIQRMPKDASVAFFRPANAPYLSVVSPSTHDMSTIRGWWEEDRAITQRFFNEELRLEGTAPLECTAELNALIVRQHLDSPAMWSIFQLQDLLGCDASLRRSNPREERINVPANPDNFWCYRMHISLEQLLSARAFNERLRNAVVDSGRNSCEDSGTASMH
jgi:4-alpha-glucanotransferase